MTLRHLFAFGIATMLFTSPNASAQSKGALQFTSDALSAFVQTTNGFISVFGEAGSSPSGPNEFATIFVADFTTNQFSNCHSRNLDLVVNNGRMALSFPTEEGENCVVGQEITIICEPVSFTRTFHRSVNGVTSVGEEHFTTHGVEYSADNLQCALHAFGVDYDATGGAGSSKLISTP